MTIRSAKPEHLLLAAYVLALAFLAFLFDGTGDDGDSLHHFLFARYAFQHPENFFNHWAKPLYVLWMAPWAQLGFTAVKLMNVGLLGLAMYCTVKIAELEGMQPRFLPVLFMAPAPIAVYWVLSGLTEPMFAAWLAVGLLLAFQKRLPASAIWLSFLPFIRSEGLIILCVLGVFLLVKRQWKLLPLIGIGHAVYALAGYRTHGSLLWVFNKIPYSNLDSSHLYGSGRWDHYIVHFEEVYGFFLTKFLWLALAYGLYRLIGFVRKKQPFTAEEIWLVYGMFVAYFAAHTVFWAKGMFNSYGLMRVMLGIIPAIGLISGRLAEALLSRFNSARAKAALAALYVVLAAWGMFRHQDWRANLNQTTAQSAFEALAQAYGDTLRNGGYTLYFDAIQPAISLNVDKFDNKKRKPSSRLFDGSPMPPHSAVIWDNRYSVVDIGTTLPQLRNDSRLQLVDSFLDNQTYGVYLFFTTDSFAQNSGILVREDFEQNKPDGTEANIGKDGGFGFKLDRQHQYSKGLSAPVSDFAGQNRLQFRFDAFAPQPKENPTVLVCSYESPGGEMLRYDATPVKDLGIQENTWTPVSVDLTVDTEKFPNAVLKIYLWNPSDSPLYLDNIQILFKE